MAWAYNTRRDDCRAVADDSVLGFEKREDAWSFRHALELDSLSST